MMDERACEPGCDLCEAEDAFPIGHPMFQGYVEDGGFHGES